MAWIMVLNSGDAAVLSDTAPVNVTKAAAAQGTAGQASRQDHRHDITTAVVGAITENVGTPLEGTATSVARSDHTHGTPATWAATAHVLSGHNAASGAIPCGGQQLSNALIENAATSPGTTTVGRIYYNTADGHLYIYQA